MVQRGLDSHGLDCQATPKWCSAATKTAIPTLAGRALPVAGRASCSRIAPFTLQPQATERPDKAGAHTKRTLWPKAWRARKPLQQGRLHEGTVVRERREQSNWAGVSLACSPEPRVKRSQGHKAGAPANPPLCGPSWATWWVGGGAPCALGSSFLLLRRVFLLLLPPN